MHYSTKQVKDSGIFTIFVGGVGGGGGVRHNFWEIWRGVRANLRLLRGEYCVLFLLARLIFSPPPPPLLIIIAQSLNRMLPSSDVTHAVNSEWETQIPFNPVVGVLIPTVNYMRRLCTNRAPFFRLERY